MWKSLRNLLQRSRSVGAPQQAHMTFAHTSIGSSLSRTRLLLKKQLWVWPIIAVVILATVGYAVSGLIQRTMEDSLRSELSTLLSVERSMLEKWFAVQESSALTLANSQSIRQTIMGLVEAQSMNGTPADAAQPINADELRNRLSKELEPALSSHDFVGYVVVDKQLQVVAAFTPSLVGQIATQFESLLKPSFAGGTTVCPPFPSIQLLKDASGQLRGGVPTMFVCAPVRDANLQIVAVLAMRIRPEKEFTEILQLGRVGDSGETYAINKNGLLVSNSRFDESLILLGLLPDTDEAASILNVQVRDPGGDMTTGFRPTIRRRDMPLTQIADAAISGTQGVNLAGFRNYRGVESIGAWTWLPKYQLGVITEINSAEAFRPLIILQRTFYALYALLGIGAIAIFAFTLIVARLQRQARAAAVEAKQLGQYRLEERLGSGAMGVVYKGKHSMLRRPTAIKMLDVDQVSAAAIERFEREVQITCNLNNPHTVAIYDYGRTPEGVFYYAMEFLDGINLQTLVELDGPQAEGRVVSILKQICASLYEAHSLGLVHRDIKPANIMLNRRGAEPDVVKVLDFGLVKALSDGKADRESGGSLSGTPLYMSPEAIQVPDSVDSRSDLYAVGAVGYFLLTAQTVFNANTLAELCQQHISANPDVPSQRLGRAVSPELEHALLACLEKNRAKRPQTARDLVAMLDRVAAVWTLDDAETWWSRFERGQPTHRQDNPPERVVKLPKSSGDPVANPAQGTIAPSFDRTVVYEPPNGDG
jgi:serine/threonine protein kinase